MNTALQVVCRTVLLAAGVLGAVAARGGVTLIENGAPAAVIVTADEPGNLIRYAVEELNVHLQRMSGARLDVVGESAVPAADTRPRILVGDTRESAAAGLTTAALEPETAVVRCSGSRLMLIGGDRGTPRQTPPEGDTAIGTLYAVYDLLETDLGVRWLWPGDTGTVIPPRATVRIEDAERRFQPPLIQRNIRPGLNDWDDAVARLGLTAVQAKAQKEEWTRWARRRHIGRRATFRFGHAFNYWLRDYGHEHPDWFAMMPDGTRVTPEKPYPSLERAKLCVTNPALLDFIAQRGLDYLEANPEVLSFSACPNDSRGYCMCPTCKALDPPEGLPTEMNYPGQNFMYPSLSDRYVWFWNQLAQRLGDKCPGRYIGAYAYSNYNHPPLREKLSSRVIIAYVGFNYLNAEYNEQSRKDWAGWVQTGCKLYLRPNLLLVGHGLPLNYARELGADIQTCYRTGMLGTDFDSMTHQYAAQAPIFYVLTGLLWNPERNVDELYAEFLDAAYGPAAPAMRRYWDRLESLTTEIARYKDEDADHDRDVGFHRSVPAVYNAALLAELRGVLAEARQAAGTDAGVLSRISACETAVTYAEIQGSVLAQVARYTTHADNLETLAASLKCKREFFQAHLTDWTIGLQHVYWRESRSGWHQKLYGGGFEDDLTQPNELTKLIHWRFRIDPDGQGENAGWQRPDCDDSAWKQVTCLTFWEQQGHKDYDGYAWYRCTITAPEEWRQYPRITLRFGAVDESFRLYVDGAMIHESLYDAATDPDLWKKPRLVDLTPSLRFGSAQTLAVRVHDSAGAGGLWKPVLLIHE